jgi:UDP-N-acetylglucosamine--N-acetylmuramyl-(pentapeptide) pyrophosphoryl-undecaprenol N-acetylglucosamine transferase
VIHDSDAHPGLTNRVLGKFADAIATGAPLKYYNYPVKKSRYVGVPISSDFKEFSSEERLKAKNKWGVNINKPLVVVTGGGLGATRINDTVKIVLDDLLSLGSVVLVSGDYQYNELRATMPKNDEHFQLHSFISKDISSLLGAADVVVARAGATSILELAALVKPTILVPNAHLTGGHQSKNAAVYVKKNAVVVINEDEMIKDPQILVSAVNDILLDSKASNKMARSLCSFSKPDAAREVAEMVINTVK